MPQVFANYFKFIVVHETWKSFLSFAEEFTERSKATSAPRAVDHELLRKLDDQLRAAVCSICNVSLTDDQWLQASLQVHNGGLGLRHVSSLASSAFLAFAAGTCQLQDHILHRVSQVDDEILNSCLLTRVNNGTQPLYREAERTWDKVTCLVATVSRITGPDY